MTNSNLEAEHVITVYNGRAEIENRIKEGKNTLRWDKTSCHRFAANQARLLVGCLAYNLLHMIRDAAFWGESVKPSIDSIIRRLVKVGARVVYHAEKREGSNLHFSRPKLPLKHSNRFALFHLLCCNQSDCPAIVRSVGVPPLFLWANSIAPLQFSGDP